MNENENHRSHAQDARIEQAPSSLIPTLLARLKLDESGQAPVTSLAALRTALADSDWTVRADAVQGLERLSDQESFTLLLSALHDEDASVRASAVRVLGMRGNPEERVVLDQLETALHDAEWHVRETSVYALDALGGQTSLLALKNALDDPDAAVRYAALKVTQRLQQEAHQAEPIEVRRGLEQAPQSVQIFVGTWLQRIRGSALRLLPRFYPEIKKELNMLEETQDVADEREPRAQKPVSIRPTRSRRPLVRILEQGLAVVLVLAIASGWFALSHLPHLSSGSPGVFSDTNARQLGAPASTFQGNLSYVEEWSTDSRTFFSLQVDTQKHQLEVRMLDAASERSTTYPVLDSSWIAALNQYNIFQVGHYLVALRPQGKNLATLEIWDITGQRATTVQTVPAHIGGNGQILSPFLASSDNLQKLAMLSPDGTITIWDVASGQKLVTCEGKASVTTSFPPLIKWYNQDQSLLLSDRNSGQLEAWNAVTGMRLFSLNSATRTYFEATVSPDSKYLSLSTGPRQPADAMSHIDALEILDAHSGQVLHTYPLNVPRGAGVSFTWLPDSMRLVTIYMYSSNTANSQGQQAQIRVWNVFTDQTTFTTSSSHVESFWTTPDGRYLILGSPDGRSMEIWQTSSGHRVATLATPGIYPNPYSFSAINNQYMIIGEKSSFDIWDIATGKLLYKYHGFTPFSVDGNGGSNVFWSPDGKYLTMIAWKTSSVGDGTLAVWRMP